MEVKFDKISLKEQYLHFLAICASQVLQNAILKGDLPYILLKRDWITKLSADIDFKLLDSETACVAVRENVHFGQVFHVVVVFRDRSSEVLNICTKIEFSASYRALRALNR